MKSTLIKKAFHEGVLLTAFLLIEYRLGKKQPVCFSELSHLILAKVSAL